MGGLKRISLRLLTPACLYAVELPGILMGSCFALSKETANESAVISVFLLGKVLLSGPNGIQEVEQYSVAQVTPRSLLQHHPLWLVCKVILFWGEEKIIATLIKDNRGLFLYGTECQ